MQNFNIVKTSNIDKTFRVAKICDEYDLRIENSIQEKFNGFLELPKKWQIGLIVGASGTGKTTIAKELFSDFNIQSSDYNKKSVIDDFQKDLSFSDISKMLYSVDFGSVPSWVKPYSVLSNGEKMRVDLARALLENDKICFDEFTSVVDRNVAKTACIAVNKAIKRSNKQAVFVSCHYDVSEYLQPDWIFDTSKMQMVFHKAHALSKNTLSESVGGQSGKFLASITI